MSLGVTEQCNFMAPLSYMPLLTETSLRGICNGWLNRSCFTPGIVLGLGEDYPFDIKKVKDSKQ